MIFCIPPKLVEKLKQSALRSEVDIAALYDLDSKGRRDFFTKHTDAELGKLINVEFEKAMISQQKDAMLNWVKSIFDPKAKQAPVYKTVLDKINNLDALGVLTPETEKAFLEDLVSDTLGITVTPDEVREISARAQKIQAAQEKLGNDLGDPSKIKETLDFLTAKSEMDKYLLSKSPAPNLRVLTGTIGRGTMLANPASPLLNVASNAEMMGTEYLGRRLAGWMTEGADNKLAKEYVDQVWKVYQSTGYDMSRMRSLNDSGASGGRVLGEMVHAQGPGPIRAVGRFYEDMIFKQLYGAPDVWFASRHFADSINLNSLKMMMGNKLKARELMLDSMRLDPKTNIGKVLRAQGILDAEIATYTNDSKLSELTNGLRKVLNNVNPNLRIGDYTMPFVQTPSNVISTGMDYAGVGAVKALGDTYKAFKSGNLSDVDFKRTVARNLIRSGIGLSLAPLLITSMLDDDDFVGAYDPARVQIEQLRNSNYNAFRIGDTDGKGGKWVSADYLGPLSVPVTSIMYARKYGKRGASEKLFQFSKGVASQIFKLPGIQDAMDYNRAASKKDMTLEEATGETKNFIVDEATSRLVPGIFAQVGKLTDKYERKAGKGLESLQSKIPFWRESLPAKTNIFGEKVKTEGGLTPVLSGSRIKTNKENPLISEIRRVSDTLDKPINFTDWSKTSNKKITQFKDSMGAIRFIEARTFYGQTLKENLSEIMTDPDYTGLSTEEQYKLINKADQDAIESTFDEYDFNYEEPQ